MSAFQVSAFLIAAVITASGAPNGSGETGGGEAPPAHVLQIQAREVWTSAGERVANGVVVVADGRIRAVGDESLLDPAQPLLRHDGVVTAGLVACRAETGTAGELQDDTRSVLAAARAADALDRDARDFERLRAAGITAIGIAPGDESLVGGLACVAKTTGRVLEDEAALSISLASTALGRSVTQGGFLFGSAEEEEHAGAAAAAEREGGPEVTARTTRGTREPTSYAGALAMLDALLARGEGAFARVKAGELPVSIEAWDRHEVLRAARFAASHRLTGSIRGAPLAGDPEVVAALKASGLGVVVGPYSAGQTRRSLESLQRLAEAGVPVGFALDAPAHAAEELRLSGVRALRAGASPAAVWKALTEDGARLAGAGDRIGRIASGLDADLVLWSGDPLDLTSRVVAVFVDGVRVHSAATGSAGGSEH